MTEDPVVSHRGLLFTVSYEMLGSVADAEDIVPDTGRRGTRSVRTRVPRCDSPWILVPMTTRRAVDRLGSTARWRAKYVGEWSPHPLPTAPDVADDVQPAEIVSFATLTVVER